MPAFWSTQFGVNIKSVGVPTIGDEVVITQGSLAERRFVAVYGYQGRVIAAVTFDQAKWLEFYQRADRAAAPFPPAFATVDRRPEGLRPVPAEFPDPSLPTHGPTVTLTGYSPSDRRVTFTPARADGGTDPHDRHDVTQGLAMTSGTPLRQILDYANRADPIRSTPSSARRRWRGRRTAPTSSAPTGRSRACCTTRGSAPTRATALAGRAAPGATEEDPGLPPASSGSTRPSTTGCARLATRPFGPPHTPGGSTACAASSRGIVTGLIDGFAGRNQIDIVDDFAYPFPVTVICRLLGVPREDEPRFHVWADAIVAALDPDPGDDPPSGSATRDQARRRAGPVSRRAHRGHRREQPGDDLLSALATDDGPDGRMTTMELLSTAVLLLIAGHETTVNLITNGMLTLLRHPDVLERLRARTRPGRPAGRGAAALRAAGAAPAAAHRPRRHRHRAAPPSPRARRSCWCSPPATATPTASTTRPVRPRPPGQPAPRLRQRHPLLLRRAAGPAGGADRADRARPPARRTPGWWTTRRRTGRTRSCAARATSRSPSTTSPHRPGGGGAGHAERR